MSDNPPTTPISSPRAAFCEAMAGIPHHLREGKTARLIIDAAETTMRDLTAEHIREQAAAAKELEAAQASEAKARDKARALAEVLEEANAVSARLRKQLAAKTEELDRRARGVVEDPRPSSTKVEDNTVDYTFHPAWETWTIAELEAALMRLRVDGAADTTAVEVHGNNYGRDWISASLPEAGYRPLMPEKKPLEVIPITPEPQGARKVLGLPVWWWVTGASAASLTGAASTIVALIS